MNTKVSNGGLTRYAKALAVAAANKNPEALRLIMELTNTQPCPKCQYINMHCRCQPEDSTKVFIGYSSVADIYSALDARQDLSGPVHVRIKALIQEIEDLKAQRAKEHEVLLGSSVTPSSTPAALWRLEGEEDPHKGKYDEDRAKLTLGKYTDDELANGVFMNYDVRPPIQDIIAGKAYSPIAWVTAAKDRIRWLSRSLSRAQDNLAGFKQEFHLSGDGHWVLSEDLEARPDKERFKIMAYSFTAPQPKTTVKRVGTLDHTGTLK